MPDEIKIIIIDDHELVRKGIIQLCNGNPDIKVIGDVENGRQAVNLFRETRPDVVVLDLFMEGLKGEEVVLLLKEEDPLVKIVILTMYDKEPLINYLLSTGIMGYVLKTAPGSDVVEAIKRASRNQLFLSQDINEILLRKVFVKKELPANSKYSDYDKLTNREQQVFKLSGQGRKIKEISEFLFISKKTVQTHLVNIRKKLNISGHNAIMKYAIKIGVVDPEFLV
jgi:DNA-binding NarL/FixJ family response regulator